MCTNTSRIRRSSSTKVRRQALHRATELTESVDSVADRPQALPAAWWPVMAARTIWRPHAGAGPARQALTASKPPAMRLSHHRAGRSLSLASSRSFAHYARHRRRSHSAELARAHRHPSLQSAALKRCLTLLHPSRLVAPIAALGKAAAPHTTSPEHHR